MADEPRTPLTLEYSPEGLDNDDQSKPVIIVEPSFAHPGRIFVGIHPLGNLQRVKRAGVHLLPDDARRVMNHLAKLLMELPPEIEEDGTAIDWQARIEEAAQRARAPKPARVRAYARLRPEFRFEFKLGRLAGVIGTQSDE